MISIPLAPNDTYSPFLGDFPFFTIQGTCRPALNFRRTINGKITANPCFTLPTQKPMPPARIRGESNRKNYVSHTCKVLYLLHVLHDTVSSN